MQPTSPSPGEEVDSPEERDNERLPQWTDRSALSSAKKQLPVPLQVSMPRRRLRSRRVSLGYRFDLAFGVLESYHRLLAGISYLSAFRDCFVLPNRPLPMCSAWLPKWANSLGLRRIPAIRMLPVRISPLVWSVGLDRKCAADGVVPAAGACRECSILAHEMAHVRRKDHLARLLELLVSTLFWWHPVVWWACRELQQLEELCCDAMVVGVTPSSRKAYVTALLDTLDFLCDGLIAAPLGATAAKSPVLLARRIAMLKNRTGVMRLTLGRLVLLLLVAAVPMAIAFAAKPPTANDNPNAAPTPPSSAPRGKATSAENSSLFAKSERQEKTTGLHPSLVFAFMNSVEGQKDLNLTDDQKLKAKYAMLRLSEQLGAKADPRQYQTEEYLKTEDQAAKALIDMLSPEQIARLKQIRLK